jgi:hypothetical protein
MAVVSAAIIPLFAGIRNSWASREASAEIIQNGRVLIDHIEHNLSKAVRITSVSSASLTNGYIEFEDNDGNNLRYDVAANNYIEFGIVGSLSDLAGPVSQLQFICYDGNDFSNPTTDVNSIRFVKVQTTLVCLCSLTKDKTFSTSTYIRTNGNIGAITYDYYSRVQGTNIFAYSGEHNPKFPSDPTTPSSQLNSTQYDGIELDNGSFYVYSVPSDGKYGLMRFVVQIDQDEGSVEQIVATWNGKCVNGHSSRTDGASLYIWNYDNWEYELLQDSGNTEAEVTLSGSRDSQVPSYIGGAGGNTITLLVASNDKRTGGEIYNLCTDYVKVELFIIYP